MHKSTLTILFIATFSAAPLARGCDLCGCYTPQLEALPPATADVVFGQFTGMTPSSKRSWMTGLYG
ncbi:MAG TPA: hypothetical protein VF333_09875, partial [Pyrinomonadaceae bacterium]